LINNDDPLSAAKAMPKLSASRETLDFAAALISIRGTAVVIRKTDIRIGMRLVAVCADRIQRSLSRHHLS
jgi:hypothetical protein